MTMEELHACHDYSSTDSLIGDCRYCNPRPEDLDPIALDPDSDLEPPITRAAAINYSLAGRGDVKHTFRDFRSPRKARRRHRERNEKYYSYRGVKPGQLHRLHYTPNDERGCWYATPLAGAPVQRMTKQQLYRDAQEYPRPPKTHRSKPWEKLPYGTNNRYNGRKHAHRRFDADVEDAVAPARWWSLAKNGWDARTPGLDWSGDGRDLEVEGYDLWRETETEECGCACAACHRECCEQQRRDRVAYPYGCYCAQCHSAYVERQRNEEETDAQSGEGEDGEWELLSLPSSEGLECADEWDIVDIEIASEPEEGGDWILTHNTADSREQTPPWTSNPFKTDRYFDEEGYLPYKPAHFVSDINTGRCRACIATYLTHTRLKSHAQARLSDIAFLRGIPVSFTSRTWEAGVPFNQLLPALVKLEQVGRAGGVNAEEIVLEARGELAGDWYSAMAKPWWRQDAAERLAALYDGEEDPYWMLSVGCE